jgi:hypothetical protein
MSDIWRFSVRYRPGGINGNRNTRLGADGDACGLEKIAVGARPRQIKRQRLFVDLIDQELPL